MALAVVFLAGFAGLIYEVVWTRALTLTFGGTVVAAAAVLCAFMGGLALGSFLSGRWADRSRSLPLLVAGAQIALATMAALLPSVLDLLTGFYVAAHRALEASFLTMTALRFVLSVAVLLAPAAAIAAVFPIVVKLAAAGRARVGPGVALVYGLDTMGGVTGAAVGGFVLLPSFGVSRSIAVAIGANLVAAALAFAMHRRTRRTERDMGQADQADSDAAADAATPSPSAARVLVWAFGLSGAAALTYEVLLTKALMNIVGMHAYAFTTMLSCFLFGMGAGSLATTSVLRGRRIPLYLFAGAELGIAIIGFSLPAQFTHIPGLIASLQRAGTHYWLGRVLTVSAIMVPPALLMGATLPLLLPVLSPGLRRLGRSTGALYAANTLGATVGVLAASFLLLPLAGFKAGMMIAGCASLTVGLVALCYSAEMPLRVRGLIGFAALLAVGAAAQASAGSSLRPVLLLRQLKWKGAANPLVRYYEEGANGTVGVVRLDDPRVGFRHELWLNGGNEGGTDVQSLRAFQLLGHLPFFLHGDPERSKRALVCAFGMGLALGAVTQDRTESVDCVEIVPEVLEARRYFRPWNHDPLSQPKVTAYVEDARNFVLAADRDYDVVIADATHPKSGDSWMLYTQEWYRDIRRVLAPDGCCSQWVPLHAVSRRDFWSIVKTFQSVFPHTTLWSPPGSTHAILVGTPEETVVDFARLKRRLNDPGLRWDFAEAEMSDVFAVLSCFVAGEGTLARASANAPINTDDLCRVQFSGGSPRSAGLGGVYHDLVALKESPAAHLMNLADEAGERARISDRIAADHEASKLLRRGVALWRQGGEARERAMGLLKSAYALNPADRDVRLMLGYESPRLRSPEDLPAITPMAAARHQLQPHP